MLYCLFFYIIILYIMLIPLGFHCNVSFLNKGINIKNETGVFEWFQSPKLQDITDLINRLTDNPKQSYRAKVVSKNEKYVYLNNTIFSLHYTDVGKYKKIFRRRYNRFLDIINGEKHIYFVRINPVDRNTDKDEIDLFIKSIKRINPSNKISFLLIDTIHNDTDKKTITINIENVSFHHKFFYHKDVKDHFYRQPTIVYNIYKQMLKDIGYNTEPI